MAENEQLSSLRQALRQMLAELDRILRPTFERGGGFPFGSEARMDLV
jgi:hypothetical protein